MQPSNHGLAGPVLALLVESLAAASPPSFDLTQKQDLVWSINERYQVIGLPAPLDVNNAIQVLKFPDENIAFLQRLQRLGPKCVNTLDAADDLLASMGLDKLNETEVAHALLFMALSTNAAQYRPENFILAIKGKSRVKKLNWQMVIGGFDLPNLQIDSSVFLVLFKALLSLASEEQNFDIQSLWGGNWHSAETQLSFAKAYLLCNKEDIEPSRIPGFRYGFSKEIFDEASAEEQEEALSLLKSHVASLVALSSVFEISIESDQAMRRQESIEVINFLLPNSQHMTLFMLSAPNFSNPASWSDNQKSFMSHCLMVFLQKQSPNHYFVLDGLFRQSPMWVFNQCYTLFTQDPMRTELIAERCQEMGWTSVFLNEWGNPLALDMACLRHREDPEFDMDKYLQELAEDLRRSEKTDVGLILNKFIRIKADDELRTQRQDQEGPRSVPLALKTVYALLCVLEDHTSQPNNLAPLQRLCLQSYPRLINYGEGYDEVLDKSHEDSGNKLPEEIDRRMSDLFGKMYRGELKIREVVELMRKYKTSQSAEDQDLFCCIVYGLFEEYSCLHEYPDDALATTAALFGSIINYRLVSSVALQVALALILDAVQSSSPEQSMFKFGVEALEQLRDRLHEWPFFCALLTEVPALERYDVYQQARDILRERGHEETDGPSEINGGPVATPGANGYDDFGGPEGIGRAFRSIRADHPTKGLFKEPDSSSQEKILFVINNTSNDNLTSKIKDLEDVLLREHHQWFAAYLVEQRARLEPNNQEMYVRLLDLIDDRDLHAEVLRETYVCIVKMMNADSTMSSATERSHLKTLGGWLGTLTIAKDIPIKHKNIYFIELLVEGHKTDRLPVVIPFTCKVLVQGSRSKVFKPPNPWLMEVIGLLMEIYDTVVDLKLNLKFEIEVLCKDIGLDHKKVERGTILQDRALQFDDSLTNASVQPDGVEFFEDLSLNGMNRAIRQRLSIETVRNKLQTLISNLKYPPPSSVSIDYDSLKTIINAAFEKAIEEIINPVVERSITIASISTSQLISKDYACEIDEDKYRSAARQMVKSLASNLALVTCKEPLRMSITNYIRTPPGHPVHEQFMPEGAILMCVNDNLDLACSIIAEAAEENSMSEIDLIIEAELNDRRRHVTQFPDRPFRHHEIPRWAQFVPEPYKQTPGGLNEVQQAVYDGFARTLHGVGTNHSQNVSSEIVRPVADVLQDSIGVVSVSTPAEQPAVPLQPPQALDDPRSVVQQPRFNGLPSDLPPQERINSLLVGIQRAARSSFGPRLKDLEVTSPAHADVRQLLLVVSQSRRPPPELLARQLAETIGSSLFSEPKDQLEADILVFILYKLCQLSDLTRRDVLRWLALQEDPILNNTSVTVALVEHGLVDFGRLDTIIAPALKQHNEQALKLLSELMNETLFAEEPIALRSDFVGSLEMMNRWLSDASDLSLALEINQKLKEKGIPQFVQVGLSEKQLAQEDQMCYTFKEWIKMYEHLSTEDKAYSSFLKEMHHKQLISSQEDSARFIRICLDMCTEAFELEARTISPSLSAAYLPTDALGCLIIKLVKLQGEANGTMKIRKAPYLQSILSLVVLVQNHHQITKGERFNQRVFFRLYSSTLYEYSCNELDNADDHKDMMFAFADTFFALQPNNFPSFTYAWTTLISHRVFVAGLLNLRDEAGWNDYRKLIGIILTHVGTLLPDSRFLSFATTLCTGILKVLLVLYHDFPDFLCENHYFLCSRIPFKCTQLRNLVLSAYPQAYRELPDPTTPGLKIERLDEMKRHPTVFGNPSEALASNGLQHLLDGGLRKMDPDTLANQICDAIQAKDVIGSDEAPDNFAILAALALYIGNDALTSTGRFDPSSTQTATLGRLLRKLDDDERYAMLNGFVDQIRYPNTFTNYFSKLLLHLFGADQEDLQIRETIVRVVLERLVTQRPHPWGIAILFLEMERNQTYRLWELPALAAAPQMRQLLLQLVRPH